jgi:hypothetical protein
VRRFVEQLGGVEQGLGRDAPDVEAGPAERLPALDAGGLQPELRGPDGGDIATGPGADHDQVEIGLSHSSVLGKLAPAIS